MAAVDDVRQGDGQRDVGAQRAPPPLRRYFFGHVLWMNAHPRFM